MDSQTVAVFVEFSVFNPAIHYHSVVKLAFEVSPIGDIHKHDVFVKSLKHFYFTSPTEVFLNLLRFLHFLLILYYGRFLVLEMRKEANFLSAVFMLLHEFRIATLVIVMTFLSYVFLVVKVFKEMNVKVEFEDKNKGRGFVNWYDAVHYSHVYDAILGLTLYVCLMNILPILGLNKRIFFLSHVLNTVLYTIATTMFPGFVLLCILGHAGLIRFAAESFHFKDYKTAILTISGFMVRELNYENMFINYSFIWMNMLYLSLVLSFIWMVCFPMVQAVIMGIMGDAKL